MAVTHGGNIFAQAREHGWNWRDVLDFSASINPLGPSPQVREAIVDALDRIVHYPDRHSSDLVNRLAEAWSVDSGCILTGNGATDLIHFLSRVWPHQNTTLVVPTFSEFHRAYPRAAWATAGQYPDDGLLIVTRPNNPTGVSYDVPERSGPVLVDESFQDFSSAPLTHATVRLRSLTKFQAIPGLRIGALIGPPDLVREWRSRQDPWQVNVLAEAAAIAALDDKVHAERSKAYVFAERARLASELQNLAGTQVLPSEANFYFVQLDYASAAFCRYMLGHKVLLRDCTGWPGVNGEAVRFAIRTREENDKLLELWRAFPCD